MFHSASNRRWCNLSTGWLHPISGNGRLLLSICQDGLGSTKTGSWGISDWESSVSIGRGSSMLSAEKLDKWLKPTTRTGRPGPLLKMPRLPSQLQPLWRQGLWVLGALLTTLATTAAADVTGVLMASVVAALGLFIIPARRRHGKMKMLEKDCVGSHEAYQRASGAI